MQIAHTSSCRRPRPLQSPSRATPRTCTGMRRAERLSGCSGEGAGRGCGCREASASSSVTPRARSYLQHSRNVQLSSVQHSRESAVVRDRSQKCQMSQICRMCVFNGGRTGTVLMLGAAELALLGNQQELEIRINAVIACVICAQSRSWPERAAPMTVQPKLGSRHTLRTPAAQQHTAPSGQEPNRKELCRHWHYCHSLLLTTQCVLRAPQGCHRDSPPPG